MQCQYWIYYKNVFLIWVEIKPGNARAVSKNVAQCTFTSLFTCAAVQLSDMNINLRMKLSAVILSQVLGCKYAFVSHT